MDHDAVYDTVRSYPPESLNNSIRSSLRSFDIRENVDTGGSDTGDGDVNGGGDGNIVSTNHTFKVEKVEMSLSRLMIPQISIEDSDIPVTPDVVTDSNQSTIHSGILTNGIEMFPKRVSPPRSPPLDKKIPVPNKHWNKLRRSFIEESNESGTESEDGSFIPTKSVIEDIIAQPIIRNARKEGVISDKIDQKEVDVQSYTKSEE